MQRQKTGAIRLRNSMQLWQNSCTGTKLLIDTALDMGTDLCSKAKNISLTYDQIEKESQQGISLELTN